MMYFPAICVDDFYSEPDKVREWALSLDYKPAPEGQWPGKRSEKLHLVDNNFFNSFCKKVFSLYFDLNITDVDYVVHTQFQLIEPFDQDPNSIKNTGWVHYDDDSIFGGIIYLTPNIDVNCGTSVFKQLCPTPGITSREAKQKFYKTGNAEQYDEILKMHNECFEETIEYKNKYNRMISFDADTAHRANSFYTSIPRLTQVFFVEKCDTTSTYPIHRHRRFL